VPVSVLVRVVTVPFESGTALEDQLIHARSILLSYTHYKPRLIRARGFRLGG
jgi:hypothetical protein